MPDSYLHVLFHAIRNPVLPLQWPPLYKTLLNFLGLFAFDFINFLPLGCLFATNFHFNLVISTVWPLALLAFTFVVYPILGRSTSKARKDMAETLISFTFAVFFLVCERATLHMSHMQPGIGLVFIDVGIHSFTSSCCSVPNVQLTPVTSYKGDVAVEAS